MWPLLDNGIISNQINYIINTYIVLATGHGLEIIIVDSLLSPFRNFK